MSYILIEARDYIILLLVKHTRVYDCLNIGSWHIQHFALTTKKKNEKQRNSQTNNDDGDDDWIVREYLSH